MKVHKGKYDYSISFNDLLFNSLLIFLCLFVIAFCMMAVKQKQQEKKIDVNAQFLITMEWNSSCTDDVDLYVQDPSGNIVFFQARENGLMHLDRDDLGHANDYMRLPDGSTVEYFQNIEVVTIRGISPGEYTVNAHMYAKQGSEPTPVSVKVEKLNPHVQLVGNKVVVLEQNGDEKTAVRFTINEEGKVVSTNDDPKPLASSRLGRSDGFEDEFSNDLGNQNLNESEEEQP